MAQALWARWSAGSEASCGGRRGSRRARQGADEAGMRVHGLHQGQEHTEGQHFDRDAARFHSELIKGSGRDAMLWIHELPVEASGHFNRDRLLQMAARVDKEARVVFGPASDVKQDHLLYCEFSCSPTNGFPQHCTRQPMRSRSTCEAEYESQGLGIRLAMSCANILSEMGFKPEVTAQCDNTTQRNTRWPRRRRRAKWLPRSLTLC